MQVKFSTVHPRQNSTKYIDASPLFLYRVVPQICTYKYGTALKYYSLYGNYVKQNVQLQQQKYMLKTKSKWYLLNRHPTNNNNKGINMKRKYHRSGKRCCGKICIYCGKLRRYNSNRSLVPGWCIIEEKYKTIDQFRT